MYYTKQNSIKSDYYNTYKNSAYQYSNGTSYLTLILKILLIILLLGVLFVGYIYISNNLNHIAPKLTNIEKVSEFKVFEEAVTAEDISKENLAKKVVTKESATGQVNLTQEDIANIVEIVMSKMSRTKVEMVSDTDYTKELLLQDVDRISKKSKIVSREKIDTKQVVKNSATLKETNHYNKVVISHPKDEKYTNDMLAQLSTELNSIIDDTLNKADSSYTKEIEKELTVRSNEMRIIVVEQGDTLSSIAHRAYGDQNEYIKILKANPEVIANPDQIFAGQKLRIPL